MFSYPKYSNHLTPYRACSKFWASPFYYLLLCLNLGADPGYALSLQTVDPDQLASEEASWSGSALFDIKYVMLYNKLDQAIWLAKNYKWAW